jgi:thiamine pyrophosphate-dependent acetolactate synthase large subunit-like protein
MLLHTDYHKMAEATCATGFLIARESSVASGLTAARKAAQKKSPVLINAIIDISDFRKGSISM